MSDNIEKTLVERGGRYGGFSCNARMAQDLNDTLKASPNYNALTREHREAFHMIFHKMARCCCGDPMYLDNIHDIVGYAQLLEEFLISREAAKND